MLAQMEANQTTGACCDKDRIIRAIIEDERNPGLGAEPGDFFRGTHRLPAPERFVSKLQYFSTPLEQGVRGEADIDAKRLQGGGVENRIDRR